LVHASESHTETFALPDKVVVENIRLILYDRREGLKAMPQTMSPPFSNPQAIAQAGEEIYSAIRPELEATQNGKFVAISITTKAYYVGDEPEEALEKARAAEPHGVFHLVKVGSPGAFRISHALQQPNRNWLFQ
jgi:hypothetical protein